MATDAVIEEDNLSEIITNNIEGRREKTMLNACGSCDLTSCDAHVRPNHAP